MRLLLQYQLHMKELENKMKKLMIMLLLCGELYAQAFGVGGSAPNPGVFHPPGSSGGGQYIAPGDSAGPNTGDDTPTIDDNPVYASTGSSRGNGSQKQAVPNGSKSRASGTKVININFIQDDWKIWWELNKFEFINLKSLEDIRDEENKYSSSEEKEMINAAMRKFIREHVLPVCRELLISPDAAVRASAVVTLGKLRDAESIKKVMNMMGDPNLGVRRAAMLSLGVMDYPYGNYVLMNVADDTPVGRNFLNEDSLSIEERGTSLLSSSLRKDSSENVITGKIILNLLEKPKDISSQMLTMVCEAAGLYKGGNHFHALRDIALDEDFPQQVRSAAITALGRIGERTIAPDLIYIMRSDDLEPKRAATVALGSIAYSTDYTIIDQLKKVLEEDSDANTRHFAAISLGRIGGPRVRDILFYAMKSCDDDMVPWLALGMGINLRTYADLTASNNLLSALTYTNNPDTRGAVAIAIGLSKAPYAVHVLEEILETGTEFEAGSAAMALGLTEDNSARKPLRYALKTHTSPYVLRQAAFACGILGDTEAIPDLLEIIRTTPNPFVASFAAMGIAFMGSEDAVGPLLELVNVTDPYGVRTAWAVAALGQLFDIDRRPALTSLASNSNYFTQTSTVNNLLILGF